MAEYKYGEDGKRKASSCAEPAVALGLALDADRTDVLRTNAQDFKTQWERSLSIEEFRANCMDKLRHMYGECSD